MNFTTFLGLDVHKETIAVAVARRHGTVESVGVVPNTPEAMQKLIRRYGPKQELVVTYEAGPCGYGIYRQLTSMGVLCVVAAPGLVPRRPGDRVKTDPRDAQTLARLLRSGDIPAVWVPDEEHEALRDLVRAREAAKEDRHRTRQQIDKLLLRLGIVRPPGMTTWTQKHLRWLRAVELPQPAQRIILAELIHAVDQASGRIERLEHEMALLADRSHHAPVIEALQALRGIALLSAVTLVAELGDLTRFYHPSAVMAYGGVVPSEHSSGGRRVRGSITKTGNQHVRRIIVEAAWHYRHRPYVGPTLQRRQERVSPRIREISWKAQVRLNRKYRRLVGRGKPKQKAIVAVARELLGFVWSIGQTVHEEQQGGTDRAAS